MSKHKKIKVAITCGDLNGIGLEVVLKTLADSRVYDHCIPVIYAAAKAVNHHTKALGLEGVHFHSTDSVEKLDANKVNVYNVWKDDPEIRLGDSTKVAGEYAFRSLKAAVEDIASNKMDVLVTAPINKANMQSKDFNFPGHTEFLGSYANEEHPLMILVHEGLRVALVTGHVPLKEVPSAVSSKLIFEKLRVFARSLSQDFGIHRPRIAVLGLNPHNGDRGLMGDEEGRIIAPAVNMANDDGLLVFGPYAADGFFGSALRQRFDGVLAMYHDQGLAPFKALAFEEGVNFTAGLPIVRTSPDHGVAYDIAGKGLASETSFRRALLMACDIYNERKLYREISANPLVTQDLKAED